MKTVGFVRMEDGTREDYLFLAELKAKHDAGTADRVLACLEGLKEGPSGY